MTATTITSKGQVTIPKTVRGNDYMKRIDKVRGTLKSDMTDQIMELLRGE